MSDNTQQETLWSDERIDREFDRRVWRQTKPNGGAAQRLCQEMRDEYQAALAARDERIKALEQYVKDNDEDCAMQLGLMAMDRDKALADCDQLRQQLAEAQRWTPVETDFEYKCQCADCLEDTEWQWQLYANRDTIGICDVHGDGDRYIYLPANVRLCRQVDAAQGGGDSEVR